MTKGALYQKNRIARPDTARANLQQNGVPHSGHEKGFTAWIGSQ